MHGFESTGIPYLGNVGSYEEEDDNDVVADVLVSPEEIISTTLSDELDDDGDVSFCGGGGGPVGSMTFTCCSGCSEVATTSTGRGVVAVAATGMVRIDSNIRTLS